MPESWCKTRPHFVELRPRKRYLSYRTIFPGMRHSFIFVAAPTRNRNGTWYSAKHGAMTFYVVPTVIEEIFPTSQIVPTIV